MDFGVDISLIDENKLVAEIQEGNTDSFQIISKRYMPVINYYLSAFNCSDNDKDDITQEALLALYSAAGVYNFSSASFSTFASVCIKRSIITSLRKLSGKKNIPNSLLTSIDENIESADVDPENAVINKESYIHFLDKIKFTLSSFEYNVITAYLRFGTYVDVAQALGIDVKDVNNALHRARKKIRKINR
ncbi:MAG: sigma-70 family RNA polymerase sigma factor [Acutalibacteraceae bacterium]|nr:sigma-70 family RNA polymerase sigma factor [Acutalibacteraceae bacterium]